MNIIVCVKQVPAAASVDVDPENGTLIRGSAGTKMNPYDLFALETAIRIKESYGARITILTMGPNQAQKVLQEAYMMDADDCILLSDKAFAGADVLATSYALSQAIQELEPDLIICGKQTTDGDTAQVGPAIAEFLHMPHAAWVSKINNVSSERIQITQELNDDIQAVLDLSFPALITVEKDIYQVRLPSYKTGLKNKDCTVKTLSLKDMRDKNANHYGLNGSATQVEKIFPPDHVKEKVTIDGFSETVGDEILTLLRKAHVV